MWKAVRRFLKDESGVTTVEVVVILAVILAAAMAFGVFSPESQNMHDVPN